MKKFIRVIKKVFKNWAFNADPREAACIAFYTIFSLAPILVIGVFVIGLILDESSARAQIVTQVQALIGEDGARSVETVLNNVTSMKHGIIASTLGLLVLLYGASKVFAEMRFALNKIFHVKASSKTKSRILSLVRGRLLGFALVGSLGFFLLVSLFMSALLSIFSSWLAGYVTINLMYLSWLNILVSVLLVGLIFGIILKVLPERKVPWKYIWSGALVSSITFSVGKDLIGYYLGSSGVSSAYGAAGSVVVLLIWVYFTVQTLLLGAEVTSAQIAIKEEDESLEPVA